MSGAKTEPSPKRVGFIGKTNITPQEEALLKKLGLSFALAKRTTVLIPQKGACEAVRVGVEEGEGTILTVEKDTLSQSAHCFVYADDRLMDRLLTVNPEVATNPKVFLMQTPEHLEEILENATLVLAEKGITL